MENIYGYWMILLFLIIEQIHEKSISIWVTSKGNLSTRNKLLTSDAWYNSDSIKEDNWYSAKSEGRSHYSLYNAILGEFRANCSYYGDIGTDQDGILNRFYLGVDVVSATDGTSLLAFSSRVGQQHFVSVKHCNHLGAMTNLAMILTSILVDFTAISFANTFHKKRNERRTILDRARSTQLITKAI